MKKQLLVSAVVSTLLSMNVSAMAGTDPAATMEKCYGIAKAGKNDCSTARGNACAGMIHKDKDPQAWIFVPKGTCNKIAGGSVSPKE